MATKPRKPTAKRREKLPVERVSLHPLTPDEALRALLGVKLSEVRAMETAEAAFKKKPKPKGK